MIRSAPPEPMPPTHVGTFPQSTALASMSRSLPENRYYPGMAKTMSITDDIDGSPNAETISFSFDGTSYEIDLGKKNRTALEKALKPYIAAAEPVSRRSSGRGGGRRSSGGPKRDLAAIRAWAHEQGYEVSERGRIAQAIVEEYDAAH